MKNVEGRESRSIDLTKFHHLPECIQPKFEVGVVGGGEREEELLIASCLTFMGINIATDKILFGCNVRQQ